MPAENFLSDLRRFLLVGPLQQINQGVSVGAVQSVRCLSSGHGDLTDLLTQLDSRLSVDFHHFVNAAQRRLPLTRHEVCADAEAVDFVILRRARKFCGILSVHQNYNDDNDEN